MYQCTDIEREWTWIREMPKARILICIYLWSRWRQRGILSWFLILYLAPVTVYQTCEIYLRRWKNVFIYFLHFFIRMHNVLNCGCTDLLYYTEFGRGGGLNFQRLFRKISFSHQHFSWCLQLVHPTGSGKRQQFRFNIEEGSRESADSVLPSYIILSLSISLSLRLHFFHIS